MMDILEEAKDVLHQEAQGIEKLIPTHNQNFVNAVNSTSDLKNAE